MRHVLIMMVLLLALVSSACILPTPPVDEDDHHEVVERPRPDVPKPTNIPAPTAVVPTGAPAKPAVVSTAPPAPATVPPTATPEAPKPTATPLVNSVPAPGVPVPGTPGRNPWGTPVQLVPQPTQGAGAKVTPVTIAVAPTSTVVATNQSVVAPTSVAATPTQATTAPLPCETIPPLPAGQIGDLTMEDGRNTQPRNTEVDASVGIPCYADSGVGRVADFDFTVPSGQTAVVGGVIIKEPISGKTFTKGLLLAFPTGTKVRLTVVDGFYRLTPESKTSSYFCTKVQEYVENTWPLAAIHPLSGWEDCWTAHGIKAVDATSLLADMSQAAPPHVEGTATPIPAPEKERITTGKTWKNFQAGDRVAGYWVKINGRQYQLCHYNEAPADGQVFDGVINGWDGETNKLKECPN